MDFTRALDLIRKDPDWLKKCAMAGIPIVIPIVNLVGLVFLLGWQRRIFQSVREHRDELPEPDYMNDFQLGIAPVVALLNYAPVLILVAVLAFGIPAGLGLAIGAAAQSGEGAAQGLGIVAMIVQFIGMGLFALAVIGMQILIPEMLRRGFHGEMGPLFSPRQSIGIIKAMPVPYLMMVVAAFASNFVGSLGVYLCCVGVVITQPAASAVFAHLLAQFDEKVS